MEGTTLIEGTSVFRLLPPVKTVFNVKIFNKEGKITLCLIVLRCQVQG